VFASPRERCSATWALVRPAGGVSAIAAPGASGVGAVASAMPVHRAAVQGQRNARPNRGGLQQHRETRLEHSSYDHHERAIMVIVPRMPGERAP
jgi:hypothetical protein